MITVLQLGRIKELFDEIGLENIPVVEDVEEFSTQLLIALAGENKLNTLLSIITGEEKDWQSENVDNALFIVEDFFEYMLPKFYPLLRKRKEEEHTLKNGFLEKLESEVKEKIFSILSTGNIDSLKNETLEPTVSD